jgi:hypothetical protein
MLPPRYISLPYLILTYPLIIRGSPGTLVEINNGSIIVSNEMNYNHEEQNGRIYISECSFVFNLEVKSFSEKVKYDEVLSKIVTFKNGKYILPLIKMENNTSLEIHDCDFRAILHNEENIIEGDENRTIYETCFQVSDEDPKKEMNCELRLFSTICSNFHRVLGAENSSLVILENCHLSDCLGDAINVKNVRSLAMRNNIIANCNNAVKIDFDYTHFEGLNSTVKILENEITQNNQKGIAVSSCYNMNNAINFNFDLKFKAQLNLEIVKNKLYQNKFNAIAIENLFADKINISENEIKYNFEAGVYISNVFFNNPLSTKKDSYM